MNVCIPRKKSRLQRQVHVQSAAFFNAAHDLGLGINLDNLFTADDHGINPWTENLCRRHENPFLLNVVGSTSPISNYDSGTGAASRSSRCVFRRQRSPTHVLPVPAPFDPSGRPFGVSHPNPALIRVFVPSAIVISDFGKGLVGIKIPTDFIVINPVSARIWLPILRQSSGFPNLAYCGNPHKLSLRRNALTKDVYSDRHIWLRNLGDHSADSWRESTEH